MEENKNHGFDWSPFTILIAEDDPANFKLLEGLLKRTNINIYHAESGTKAVTLCTIHDEINIVLMDIQLPELDGFEAAQKIKGCKPELPVIIITASIFNGDTPHFENPCYDGFIFKPFKLDHLIETVRKFLPVM